MTREEYKANLRKELEGMDANELRSYARSNHIRLYTRVPEKMLEFILDTKTTREFHGDAFRDKNNTPIHGSSSMNSEWRV